MVESNKKYLKMLVDIVLFVSCQGIGLRGHDETKDSLNQDPKNINWRREDINAASPLLEAYQTSLEEKDVTIESYKNEPTRFSSRSREIAAENENLYQYFEEADEKVEITYEEWKSLEAEVATLKEHNELLVRQAKLHQANLQDLLRSYQSRDKPLKKK